MENHAWVVAFPSPAKYSPDCLRWERRELPALQPGQLLLRTIYLSLDPSNRNALTLKPNTAPQPLAVGDVMMGQTVCVVEASRSPAFEKGDAVVGPTGWQTYAVVASDQVRKANADAPLETNLTIFSHIGYAATAGMLGVGKVTAADTVVVSAAAGATGSIAAQIGKALGAKVVGIAGGADKRRYLVDELGLDGAVDYRSEDVAASLARLCPEGVSLFFDNVGGAILDAVLMNLAFNARIAVCGQIASYDGDERPGVRNLMQLVFFNATMQGFFAGQPPERGPEYEALLSRLYRTGQLKARAHVVKGLEQAPKALELVLTGANAGKLMVEVTPPP